MTLFEYQQAFTLLQVTIYARRQGDIVIFQSYIKNGEFLTNLNMSINSEDCKKISTCISILKGPKIRRPFISKNQKHINKASLYVSLWCTRAASVFNFSCLICLGLNVTLPFSSNSTPLLARHYFQCSEVQMCYAIITVNIAGPGFPHSFRRGANTSRFPDHALPMLSQGL